MKSDLELLKEGFELSKKSNYREDSSTNLKMVYDIVENILTRADNLSVGGTGTTDIDHLSPEESWQINPKYLEWKKLPWYKRIFTRI